MSDTPVKIVVDLSKPQDDPTREQIIPLTAEEIADLELRTQQVAEKDAELEAARQAKEELKASAKAKLIAGQPLTAEEADTLIL
jgi:hypothetical protein